MLAACSPGGGASNAADMALGPANAKVTVIEYASVTCAHCFEFHRDIWPKLKTNYIDTGKIRFVFRELPTAPEEAAVAGFQMARCGGANDETYFKRIGLLFDKQASIFEAYQKGEARDQLFAIAREAGLSDGQYSTCLNDPEGVKRIQKVSDEGKKAFALTGTPTIIINGKKLDAPYSYDQIARAIDTALGGG